MAKVSDEAVHIAVRVQPGAKETEFAGWHGTQAKIRIRERAQDGAANEALVRFLAEILRVPRSSVTITHGLRSRDKMVKIVTSEPARIRNAIRAILR